MRRTLIMLTLGIGLIPDFAACGHSPRIDWPAVAQCGAHGAPEDLLQAVAGILLGEAGDTSTTIGDRAANELAKLAEQHGAMLVECFVDQAVRGFDAQTPRALTPMTRTTSPAPYAAARGRDFLERVAGARIERRQP